MPARALDARMFAWYKLDELAAGDYLNSLDVAGTRHLTAASIALAPLITNGPRGVRFARIFDGTAKFLRRAGDAASASLLQGDWTWSMFVRIDGLPTAGNTRPIWGYGGTTPDTDSTTNHQGSVRIKDDGRLDCFWENGSGTDNTPAQTTGTQLAVGSWYHLAVVKDATAKTVTFYINGVAQQTVAFTNNPTGGGGGTVEWTVGRGSPAGTTYFQGVGRSWRIQSGKLTAAQIAAQAALLNSTLLHDTTGAFIHWPLSEAPDAIDETDRGCHLYVTAGTVTHGVDPLVADGGRAKYFGGNAELHGPSSPDPNGVAWHDFMDGEWSFEVWLRLGDGNSSQRGIFLYGDPGPEDSPNNFFGIDLEANRKIQVFSEHTAGADTIWTSTADMLGSTQVNGPHQIVITKRNVSGGYVLRAYRDGVFVEESPTQTPDFDGGLLGFLRLATGPGEVDWYGVLDEVVFWQAVLTDEEVAELNDFGTGESSDPTPSFVAPPTYMGEGTGGIGFLVD